MKITEENAVQKWVELIPSDDTKDEETETESENIF